MLWQRLSILSAGHKYMQQRNSRHSRVTRDITVIGEQGRRSILFYRPQSGIVVTALSTSSRPSATNHVSWRHGCSISSCQFELGQVCRSSSLVPVTTTSTRGFAFIIRLVTLWGKRRTTGQQVCRLFGEATVLTNAILQTSESNGGVPRRPTRSC